MHTKTDITAK